MSDQLLARTPPHDFESERYVLGVVVAHPESYDQARRLLDSSDFYRLDHAALFHAVGDHLARGTDLASLAASLLAAKATDSEALDLILSSSPHVVENLAFHASRIRQCADWRAQIIESQRAQDAVFRQAAHRAPPGRVPDPLEIADGHDLAGMTRDAERALLIRRAPVFHRGGQLVRIRRSRGSASLESFPAPSLKSLLSEHCRWVRHTKDGPRPVKPPRDVVEALISGGTWSLREIHTLAEAPCFAPGGRVVAREGWDESGVFVSLDPQRRYPKIPEAPTREDGVAALGRLAVAFSEFPFVDDVDLAAALSLVLTLVARPAIDGSVPLFAVRGPVAGSGKGLVVHVASACAFGRLAAVSPPERDPSEERKSLLALGAEGAPLALLDNLEHALGSDVLAAALTAPTFRARELGRTRTLEVKLPVLAATGNNLQIKGDLARRCIPIDIDPKMEQPEGRAFKLEQPDWSLQNHPSLVSDALACLRSFHLAGKPQPPGVKPYGSFEPWSRLVRSCLLWLGTEDPCGGRDRLREESDTGLAELEAALVEWRRAATGDLSSPWTVRQALTAAEKDQPFLDALAGLAKCEAKKLSTHKLGYALRASARRIVRGLRFEGDGNGHARRWSVKGDPAY